MQKRKLEAELGSGRESTGIRRAALTMALLACLTLASAAVATAQSYTFQNVPIIGGGFVDGLVAHPGQNGLFYARTDVGGAYRYNTSTGKWVPLLDWLDASNWWYMGVESLAIDPRNTNTLLLAAGEYSEDYDGNGAILVSSNQGASFTTVPMSFRMGGNDTGRNGGERLMVDPNDSSIVYYGSRTNGLWKSTNGGYAWSQVGSFPINAATDGVGVIFVAFDKLSGTNTNPTPNIYVGVSTATGTGLYVSTNSGSSWSAVAGQPSGLFPIRAVFSNASDRELYVSYANAVGPTGMTTGQVWRFHATDSYWTNITPPNPNGYSYGFSAVAIDTEQAGRLMVGTMDRYDTGSGDTLFLTDTANGATTTWTDALANSTRDSSLSPWVNFGATTVGTGNWMASAIIDPFNQNHALYGTGETIWATTDLKNADTGGQTNWTIGANGLEETVVDNLTSPSTGPYVVTGCWDLGGFVNTSFTSSPAGGMSENPRLGHATGLDYAKSSAATLVRVGYGTTPFGGYSTNSGSSWTPFPTVPNGTTEGAGTVAISANGGTIVWAPSDVAPAYSTNKGSSWTTLSGYLPTGVQVVSDGYSNGIFYALDAATGVIYATTDTGTSWYTANSTLPTYGKIAAVNSVKGDLWFGSGSGLERSTNSGTSWTQVGAGSITSVSSVGFGKAASGEDYPAIYLIGTINGVTGIYRSTDEAGTWHQINGASTEYALPGPITGDPKTFGTVYFGTGGRGVIYGTSPN